MIGFSFRFTKADYVVPRILLLWILHETAIVSSPWLEDTEVWIIFLSSRGGSLYGGSSELGEVDAELFRLGAGPTDPVKESVEIGDDEA